MGSSSPRNILFTPPDDWPSAPILHSRPAARTQPRTPEARLWDLVRAGSVTLAALALVAVVVTTLVEGFLALAVGGEHQPHALIALGVLLLWVTVTFAAYGVTRARCDHSARRAPAR